MRWLRNKWKACVRWDKHIDLGFPPLLTCETFCVEVAMMEDVYAYTLERDLGIGMDTSR